MGNDRDELPAWRIRWEAAIRKHVEDTKQKKTGGSLRKISLRAGLAESYVSNTLKTRKIPVVDAFLAVCDAIGVSPVGILLDVDLTPDAEKIIKRLAMITAEDTAYVLSVLHDIALLRERQRERQHER